jgi:hypothetical protein
MKCAGCGHSLAEGATLCLVCGTPATPGQQSKGIGIAVLPEPVPPSGDNWPSTYATTMSPYGTYNGSTQPPPPLIDSSKYYAAQPEKRVSSVRNPRTITIALIVAVLLMAAVGFGAYHFAYASHVASTPGGALGNGSALSSNPLCALPNVDATAAKMLSSAQLTSGLRDITHKNYAPIDATTTFTVGQTTYFAFTVGSNALATLSAAWCWGKAGTTSYYQMSVDHNLGVDGYFDLRNLDANAVGPAVLVVRWNGAVAFASQFIVNA